MSGIIRSQTQLRDTLHLPKFKEALSDVLPKHLTPDRVVRVALAYANRTPKLFECSQASFINAMMYCAEVGLEPGGNRGVHLVPYGGEVVPITDYRGMMDLAVRSGEVTLIDSHVVYEKDEFCWSTTNDGLKFDHSPSLANDRGEAVAVYAYALLPGGQSIGRVMTAEDVNRVRESSRARNSPAWTKHWPEMWKKTAVRNLCKYLPQGNELRTVMEVEDRVESGDRVYDVDVVDEPVEEERVSRTEELKSALSNSATPEDFEEPAESEAMAYEIGDEDIP